ncbi:MAG: sulfite exporter TauE/SafE family protein [Halofilum sp. (in: g-proteobacteria)]
MVFGGTVVQGSLGFGVALIGAPLLYLIDPSLVPAPMIVVGLMVSTLVAWRERSGIEPIEVVRVVTGLLPGIALAAALMRVLPDRLLGLLFGTLVLVAVALSIGFRPPSPGRRLLFASGALSGFMGTATSIGGPPLMLAFQRYGGARLRGTVSACFVPSAALSLIALAWAGHMGPRELALGLLLLPPVALGVLVSVWTARLLDRTWLRAALLGICALAGVMAIVRALL